MGIGWEGEVKLRQGERMEGDRKPVGGGGRCTVAVVGSGGKSSSEKLCAEASMRAWCSATTKSLFLSKKF